MPQFKLAFIARGSGNPEATGCPVVSSRGEGLLRILVVDDQEAVRRRVCSTLASRADFEVCGEAADGQEAVDQAKALRPDLIVLDVTMPVMNGLDAARVILAFFPKMPILILSMHRNKQLLEEARRMGVRGYIAKEEAIQNLTSAIDTILGNQTFFPFG